MSSALVYYMYGSYYSSNVATHIFDNCNITVTSDGGHYTYGCSCFYTASQKNI